MLSVANFINTHEDWKDLLATEPYSLRFKTDEGFTQLRYSQYGSDMRNEIVRECRGLILDSRYNPVCVPFFKFGNYGESYVPDIDWETAIIDEKIDGTLILIWNYGGRWITSTRGSIFAHKSTLRSMLGDAVNAPFKTFGDLFDYAASIFSLDYRRLNPSNTYMFELASPWTRIVVPFERVGLYHIGTRNNTTLEELDEDIGIQKPPVHHCGSLSELADLAKKLPITREGFVVRDKFYNRVKVKSLVYVAASLLGDNITPKRIMTLLRSGEHEEFLAYFPECKQVVSDVQTQLFEFERFLDGLYLLATGRRDLTRKEFAELVAKHKTGFDGFMFAAYHGKIKSVHSWLSELSDDKLFGYLERRKA